MKARSPGAQKRISSRWMCWNGSRRVESISVKTSGRSPGGVYTRNSRVWPPSLDATSAGAELPTFPIDLALSRSFPGFCAAFFTVTLTRR